MSTNKKYFYIKIKDSFFEQPALILLEKMPNGYFYSNILLKMCLKSIKFEGKLLFTEDMPYTNEMLSAITGHDLPIIEQAIDIFKQLRLIEVLESGVIYMLDIQSYIGHSSTEADRQREYYQKVKDDASKESCKKPNRNPNNNMSESLENPTPELDKSILDIKEDTNTDKKESKSKKLNPRDYIKLFEQNQWFDLFRGFRNKKAIRKWLTYLEQRGSSLKAITAVSWESNINKMIAYCKTYDLLDAVEIAVESNWDGLSLGRDYSVKTEKRSLISQAIFARRLLHERFAEDRYKQSPNMTFEQFLEKKKLNKEDPSVEKLLERMRAGNHHDIIGEETPESVEQKNV